MKLNSKRTIYLLIAMLSGVLVANISALKTSALFSREVISNRQAQQQPDFKSSSSQPTEASDSLLAQADTPSDEIWELLNQAQEAERNKQMDQAKSIYRDILSKSIPTQTRLRVYLKLGDILQAQKNYTDAIAAYQAANKLSPKAIKPWVGQAEAQYHLEDLESAKRTLAEAKQYLPEKITTLEEMTYYSSLSKTLRQIGEFDESIALMGKALRLNPYITNGASCQFTVEGLEQIEIYFSHSIAQYRSARCGLGFLVNNEQAAKSWADVQRIINEAVEKQDIYAESYQKTGLNRLVSIIPHELFQPDTPNDRFNEATAISALNIGTGLMNRAITMGDRDSMEAAILFLRTSVKSDPAYAWNQVYLSSALLAQGQPDDAMAIANQVLKLPNIEGKEPGDTWVWAHNNLGYGLEQQGKTEAAMRHYEKAIALDPTFTTAKENLQLISSELK